jgi:hypothetical protein
MNALQNVALSHFRARVEDLGDIAFTGLFPDDVHRLGAHFPAVLIEDGDHPEYVMESARRVRYLYHLRLYLYHNTTIDRVGIMNRLTDELIGAILADTGFDPAVTNLQAVSVEKGEVHNGPADFHHPGLYENLTVRRITFSMQIRDQR